MKPIEENGGWLLLILQVLFWVPMVVRVALRKAPEVRIQDELVPRWRERGLLLYQIAIPLIWIGFGFAFWNGGFRSAPVEVVVGVIFYLAATALFNWSVRVHRSWNIQARLEPDHQLCTAGPYGIVRNPIYLAFSLMAIGSAVWVSRPLVILGAILLIVGSEVRARAEEKVLRDRFGTLYLEYMRRVHRIIPGIY